MRRLTLFDPSFIFLPVTVAAMTLCNIGCLRTEPTDGDAGAELLAAPIPIELPNAALTHLGGLSAGDLNGDQLPDIVAVTAYYASQHKVFVVPGLNGFFNVADLTTIEIDAPIHDLLLADIDADADLDIVVGLGDENSICVAVMLNDGSGSFSAPETFCVPSDSNDLFPMIEAVDVDGDGDLDLMAVDLVGRIPPHVLLNDGEGAIVDSYTLEGFDKPTGIESGDLDSDGDVDIAFFFSTPGAVTVDYWWNPGSAIQSPLSAPSGDRFAIGDLDQTGGVDIAIGQFNPSIAIGTNAAFFSENISQTIPLGSHEGGISTLAIGDMNGDGLNDIVAMHDISGQVVFLENQGTAQFVDKQRVAFSPLRGKAWSSWTLILMVIRTC